MSLSLLVPAFLAGLAALAIPIIIHLTRRETKEPTPFPSLMFLENLPQKRNEKRQIHRWPLLLLRALAVILLVLAFSRPFVETDVEVGVIAQGGDRELVVLLDRSYSMGMGDRWERATAAATDVINSLTVRDRGTVIFFDSGAEAATESTTDRNVLLAAVRGEQPGVRTTRYAPSLRYAGRILSASPLPRPELVVISDFQRGGWEADVGEMSSLRLPPGTQVTTVPVSDVDVGVNLTVESASFDREMVADRERVVVTGRLTASGPVDEPVPVALEIDGRLVETRQADFGEGSSAQVGFSALTLPVEGAARGVLRIGEDGLAIDNALHFVLSADQRIRVLILEGSGASRDASFFLQRALSIGSTPGFRAEVRRGGEVRAADLVGNPVVILNQTGLPGGAQGELLRRHVSQGGGLVFVLGANTLGDWAGVLPSVPAPLDRNQSGGVSLGFVDTGHPVFETFAGPRSGDFSAARVYRYRPLPTGSFPRVLARFGDGGTALAERPVDEGRVLVWTSALDGSWSDLTLQPIFLPFVHQLVKYAAGYAPPQSWLSIGQPFDARGALPAGDEYGIVLTPSSEQVRVTAGTPMELNEVGFYELRDQRGTTRLATFAANIDPAESASTVFEPDEMRMALAGAIQGGQAGGGELELTLAERERQQSAWWYVIVLAFILLAVETLFSNRTGGGEGRWWGGRRRRTENRPGVAA